MSARPLVTAPLDLVSDDGARVDQRVFCDPDLYELEMDTVFRRCWLLIGHESQLPEPGSFVRTSMGEDPVLLTRDRDGRLHAHLNICRHRGTELCRVDRGTATTFECSYHGWIYRNDGRLVGVPGRKTLYYDELDTGAWGLAPVARLDTYKGLIFATFDPDAPSLLDYLGDAAWYLDIILDRRAGGTEMLGVQKWRIPTNWKVVAENHCGDEYHVGFAHRSNFAELADPAHAVSMAREIRPEVGHGFGVFLFPEGMRLEHSAGPDAPAALVAYLHDIHDEVVDRLGSERARMGLVHGCVFPNFGLVPVFNALRICQPRGVGEVEMWAFALVDRDAPADVKRLLRATAMRTFGPSGSFEQDDGGNWADVTRVSRSARRHDVAMNLTMGLGHEAAAPGGRGEIGLTASDLNQRGFYRRWRDEVTR